MSTIAEITESLFDNYLDIDVTDTEVDMMVAFVYDPENSLNDPYNKFIDHLAKHVTVNTIKEDKLICDFSGFYKQYNDKIYDWYIKNNRPFFSSKDEAYCDLVEMTELLVAGYCTDATYSELYSILS